MGKGLLYINQSMVYVLESLPETVALLKDNDILQLQDLFFTPGIKQVSVATLFQGRVLINFFLDIMPRYYRIGCLTMFRGIVLNSSVTDIYSSCGQYNADSLYDIWEYCMECSYFDFIWIEINRTKQYNKNFAIMQEYFQTNNSNSQNSVLIITETGDE